MQYVRLSFSENKSIRAPPQLADDDDFVPTKPTLDPSLQALLSNYSTVVPKTSPEKKVTEIQGHGGQDKENSPPVNFLVPETPSSLPVNEVTTL